MLGRLDVDLCGLYKRANERTVLGRLGKDAEGKNEFGVQVMGLKKARLRAIIR